jgi:hypothetical protein
MKLWRRSVSAEGVNEFSVFGGRRPPLQGNLTNRE